MAQRKFRRARLNGYPIDLVKQEEIKYASQITDHPTESGQNLTDNIRRLPITISMECLVSDTPIGEMATDPTRQLELIEIEGENPASGIPLPSEDAHQRLVQMWIDQLPIECECSKGVFKDCAIEDVTEVSDASTGGGLSFNIRLKQIRIITNARTQAVVAIQMPTSKPVDFGLSLDKLVDGKLVLWRKGKPPGSSPATDPPGEIIGREVVHVIDGKYFHEDKKTKLTDQQLLDFSKDLNRDSALLNRRGIARAEEIVAKEKERDKKLQKLLDAKNANPGKYVDPAAFGL